MSAATDIPLLKTFDDEKEVTRPWIGIFAGEATERVMGSSNFNVRTSIRLVSAADDTTRAVHTQRWAALKDIMMKETIETVINALADKPAGFTVTKLLRHEGFGTSRHSVDNDAGEMVSEFEFVVWAYVS